MKNNDRNKKILQYMEIILSERNKPVSDSDAQVKKEILTNLKISEEEAINEARDILLSKMK